MTARVSCSFNKILNCEYILSIKREENKFIVTSQIDGFGQDESKRSGLKINNQDGVFKMQIAEGKDDLPLTTVFSLN